MAGRRPRGSNAQHVLWWFYSRLYDLLWDNALTDHLGTSVAEVVSACSPILEVGAGTGLITRHLVGIGPRVVAVEPHPEMRALLERRLPAIPVAADAVEDLETQGIGPQTVVAVNVLHLVSDPLEATRRLQALAGDHGTVVLVIPDRGATVSKVARAIRRCGGSRACASRFVLLHAVLAPLTVFARPRAHDKQLEAATADAELVAVVAGVSALLVLGGRCDPTRAKDS